MKKILVLLVLCCFSACSAGLTPEKVLDTCRTKLAEGCTFDLQFSTGQEATLRWSAEEQELCFTAPDAVEGLCYLRDGGGLTVSFEGISSKISESALPQGAAVRELYEAIDAFLIADAENVDARQEADGLLRVSTRNSPRMQSAWIDTESCLPIAVETEHWAVALALHNAL